MGGAPAQVRIGSLGQTQAGVSHDQGAVGAAVQVVATGVGVGLSSGAATRPSTRPPLLVVLLEAAGARCPALRGWPSRPDLWDQGVGKRLMDPVMDCIDTWGNRRLGLFTFSHRSFGLVPSLNLPFRRR